MTDLSRTEADARESALRDLYEPAERPDPADGYYADDLARCPTCGRADCDPPPDTCCRFDCPLCKPLEADLTDDLAERWTDDVPF